MREWLRTLTSPWRVTTSAAWTTVQLPQDRTPRWPGTCMKCGLRHGAGTMRVRAIAADPVDPRNGSLSTFRHRAPICGLCRVWSVLAIVGVVASLWLLIGFGGGGRGARGPARQFTKDELVGVYSRLAWTLVAVGGVAALLWPFLRLTFSRALLVTERGEFVDYEFRTEELAREFAACNPADDAAADGAPITRS